MKLVIFDLAGTTIQEEGYVPAAFQQVLKNHAIAIQSDALDGVRGASKREVIRRFVKQDSTADAIYEEFRQQLLEHYSTKGVFEISGTTETFLWLKQSQIQIALNTGFDRILTDRILGATGWDRTLFSAVVCSDDVAQGRPAPDMIFTAMKSCGITNVRDVTNVGDTALDLQAGHNAGVRFNIGVLSGAHTRHQLQSAPHTHLIESVATIPSVLRGTISSPISQGAHPTSIE